jgi:hypothetical protein
MLELVSHGLTGLAAVVVIAFCFEYCDEFSLLEQRPIELMDKTPRLLSLGCGKQSANNIYSGVPNESVRREAFRRG